MRAEERIQRAHSELSARSVLPNRQTRQAVREALGIVLENPTTIYKLLQRQDLDVFGLAALAPEILSELTREEKSVLENRVRYDGYIEREKDRLERLKGLESRRIPEAFDYAAISGLSREVVEKCALRRPRTLGEAGRIPGVTPAAVAIISAHVARGGGVAA